MAGRDDDAGRLLRWLRERRVAALWLVSPHLDDAAFSAAELLGLDGLPLPSVLTVFTEAGPDADPGYARKMGFADPESEFPARRREDERAMATLGVAFVHAGLSGGRMNARDAARLVDLMVEARPAPRTLVLLPAGAGRVSGRLRAWSRRIRRKPPGCAPHGEHELVRDALRPVLELRQAIVGYYAEIPYQWAERPASLRRRLETTGGRTLEPFELEPDVERKLAVARAYRSQFEAELGRTERFQRRTLGIPERLFLPRGEPG